MRHNVERKSSAVLSLYRVYSLDQCGGGGGVLGRFVSVIDKLAYDVVAAVPRQIESSPRYVEISAWTCATGEMRLHSLSSD